MGDWSLTAGWLPWTTLTVAFLAAASLLADPRRRFWVRWLPAAMVAAAALVAAFGVVVDVLWRPFPDRLPLNNLIWGWIGLTGLLVAVVRMPALRWSARAGSVGCALILVVASAVAINRYWGMYPTVSSIAAAMKPPALTLQPLPARHATPVSAAEGRPLMRLWTPPVGMPQTGTVVRVRIAALQSHFTARDGYVYLPPAYHASPRPLLPVVVLLAGQPGTPENWIDALGLATQLDKFAAQHHGLAPVAVVVDDLGSSTANPLCVDSRLGRVETYLARDVPAWIRANLQVRDDRRGWFIGGYSHGGTCALQLATRAPDVYGRFIDISGQREPTLGSRARTLKAAFNGSAAAFAQVNPLDVLKHTRFPTTAGLLAIGDTDHTYLPQQREVRAACEAAGMDVSWLEVPGGHTMDAWREAFRRSLPWLARHGGIADT
jgi:enterochelin esterase-like enzyme